MHPITWRRAPGLLAWPQGWQRPARTEEWAYQALSAGFGQASYAELVCFPWATLIDLLDRGHHARCMHFFEALADAPPRTTLVRATVCQHIRIDPILRWLKTLKITDLFWSHARVGQFDLDGIKLHPFPLYPVRALDRLAPSESAEQPPLRRRYLYSFIGAYSPEGYLTPARQWIAELPRRDDVYLVIRDAWHYEAAVYVEQIAQQTTPLEHVARLQRNEDEYDAVLLDSIFSLCPSGSGPNSIRLWESLGFGCIPVLLSDSLQLPGRINEWDEAIVRVPETREAVEALPERLEEIARDPHRLRRMQQAGQRLWLRYGQNGPITVLGPLADSAWIRTRLGSASSTK